MRNKIALVNGHIYTGSDNFIGQALLIHGQHIHGIFPRHAVPDDYEIVDVDGANICPGLIDFQIYGTGTDLFSADLREASVHRIDQQLLAQGCTSYLLTLATNSLALFKEAIAVFLAARSSVAIGLHLEGPFLNAQKRGAHPEELIVKAQRAAIQDLLADAEGAVRMMTVAPELLDDDCLQLLLDAGVLVSAGHSTATYAEGLTAFAKGIKAATHLWNAMSGLHHREPGLPGAIFRDANVRASIVVDGIHVNYEVVRLSKQLLGERLFLITDAVGACSSGPYQHVRQDDHFTLPDGTLSGSALTLLGAVKNCVEQVGIPLDEAIRMATVYPAALIGQANIGSLQGGTTANVLVFNKDFTVRTVYFHGKEVV